MERKTNIIGYWGYIPAWIAKRDIDVINKKMQENSNKKAQIEAKIDKDKMNEMAQRTDKESIKQWKKEYGKSIKDEIRLKKNNKELEKDRSASEKIIYMPVNQLILY